MADWKESHFAFHQRFRVPPSKGTPERPIVVAKGWVVRVYYNCYGGGIPVKYSDIGTTEFAKLCKGAEWAYPNFTCIREWGYRPTDGMMIDMRDVKALMAGCCPITLTNEMLGTMEMPG